MTKGISFWSVGGSILFFPSILYCEAYVKTATASGNGCWGDKKIMMMMGDLRQASVTVAHMDIVSNPIHFPLSYPKGLLCRENKKWYNWGLKSVSKYERVFTSSFTEGIQCCYNYIKFQWDSTQVKCEWCKSLRFGGRPFISQVSGSKRLFFHT